MHKSASTRAEEVTAALSDRADAASNRVSERPWAGLPPQEEADELLGRSLNETYLVEATLGEGGMGRIYRARHTRITQKLFAIKVLRPELAHNPGVQARFQREAETAACISHPNVVGVYDVGRTLDGWSYLVCEFLEGLDLAAYIEQRGHLDTAGAAHIALQVCDALIAAHERSVVHRDLKPHNVFLLAEPSGEVCALPTIKVLDFGLSRFLDTSDAQLTKTGVIMGTPAYMTPEQARAERGDHRVDIYGVGALLYASLTGRPPFKEDTLHATVLSVMTAEPERPRTLNPNIPEALELVIQRAMSKDPNDRFATMVELRAALEPFHAADAPARAGAPGAHRASRAMLHTDDFELSTSRARLLFYMLFSVALCATVLATAVSGLELFTGPISLSRTELALVLIAGFGTLLTPVILLVARLRTTVWGNSARVLELLDSVRRPLFAAVIAYGLASLGLRFGDEVLSRFGVSPVFSPVPGSSWAGLSLVLPLVALIAAGMSLLRQRWDSPDAGRWRRHALGAPLMALTTLACVALLVAGARWRASAVPTGPETGARAASHETPGSQKDAEVSPGPSPETEPAPLAGDAANTGAQDSPPEVATQATDEALAAAMAQGVEGLLPLSEKRPKDPRVLKPLVLAFASRAATLADAMDTTKRLFAVAPEEVADPDLRFLVKRAAQTPGDASTLSLELMTSRMGTAGPDLLYELLSVAKVKPRVEALLASAEVRAQSSPALRIAQDLRLAKSCAARLPLLERAGQLGDDRSIAILAPLTTGTKTGCGRWKRSPCQAACAKEAAEYRKAIQAITARQAKSARG